VGNTIAGVGLESVENQGRAGIALIGATTGRIIGNEVMEIGPESFLGVGYGIAIAAFSESIEVLDNIVHRGRTAVTDPEGASGSWVALWIQNFRQSRDVDRIVNRRLGSLLDMRFIPRRGNFDTAVLFRGRAFLIVGQPSVAARGNVFDTYGEPMTVWIGISGPCIFGENRCASRGRFMENSPWIVGIEANAVVASGNVISGNAEPDSNFELVGLNIDTGAEDRIGLATVLGNIVTPTTIRLNNNPLGDPWAPLNL
jgi:hypothetical protein